MAEQVHEIIKKLREGQEVICPVCGKGHLKTKGDAKESTCFICDSCGEKLNIN